MVIKADALHYKTDLYSNGAILLALVLMNYTTQSWIDPVLGLFIAVYMIYSAFPIIKEGILMLLDVALPKEDLELIKKVITQEEQVSGYHLLQTREAGSNIYVSVHVVFNLDISLYDAHLIADRIEDKIKKLFSDKSVHIIIHMDPYDDLTENSL